MSKAEQALMEIKKALDKGEEQVENGELLEMELIESVNAIVEDYFKNK